MNPEKIGVFIRKLRNKKGLTQEQLALLIPANRTAISKWEHGKNIPDLTMLIRLSKLFDVSIDELIKGRKNRFNYYNILLFLFFIVLLIDVIVVYRILN